MYHWIVTQQLRHAFHRLNRGDPRGVTDRLAPHVEHTFTGDHALGGTRSTRQATQAWYARLLRLLPDIHFTVEHVRVSGPPWHTRAVIGWTETNSGTDGVRTTNRGVNDITLRWGRLTRIAIHTDPAILQATLDRLARAGTPEAHAPPITEAPPHRAPPVPGRPA